MKFRQDYVTNSSSASYIICFARIADEEKAKKVIDEYKLDILNANDVRHEMRWSGYLGAYWAGAELYGTNKILEAHPDDKYIIIEDYLDGDEIDYDEVIYYYDFPMLDAIDQITTENGFDDIDVAEGEGRNG